MCSALIHALQATQRAKYVAMGRIYVTRALRLNNAAENLLRSKTRIGVALMTLHVTDDDSAPPASATSSTITSSPWQQ